MSTVSTSSSTAASASSFHFSPQAGPVPNDASPLHSPISPIEPSPPSSSPPPGFPPPSSASPVLLLPSSTAPFSPTFLPAPVLDRPPLSHRASSRSPRVLGMDTLQQFPQAPTPVGPPATPSHDSSFERQRRVSYAGPSLSFGASDTLWARTTRASSEDQLLGSRKADDRDTAVLEHDQALFREHERRSLESSAQARLAHSSAALAFLPPASTPNATAPAASATPSSSQYQLQTLASPPPPLFSPPLQAIPALPPVQSAPTGGPQYDAPDARATASLHLGDLDVWMDEAYVRECCTRMGWDGVTSIKMIRGSSPTSGYCFLTFPSTSHAAQVLARFNAAPPTLMPRSSRTFKLNWGTGYPGLQPRWDGEYSVFVGDLGREVGEAELVSLFTPIFPSTKSAKIMYDPTTAISRGYGFVRFADESDMQRALLLGQNAGSGLSLHGRTLRISEASGPGDGHQRERTRTRSGEPLQIHTQGGRAGYQHAELSPTTAYSPDFLAPSFPRAFSPLSSAYGAHPLSPTARSPLSPALGFGSPLLGHSTMQQQQQHHHHHHAPAGPAPHTTDPNNTTVFVGGLPACISEETLKSFFHHFGEITYCKIPTGKGCGFVQFVRRADAELAIAKMNDFPIHGKSRIRLSWGRSQGDKQVEHVRKLASALGVQFDAVWRMVQGQDNTTIKQIATAVGGPPAPPGMGRLDSLGVGRMELGAVASAAGLTEAEVLDLVGGRGAVGSDSVGGGGERSNTQASSGGGSSSGSRTEADFYGRSAGLASPSPDSQGGGPYSRVSPSIFSAFSSASPSQSLLPLSPPPSAGAFSHVSQMQHQQQHQHHPHHQQLHEPSNSFGSPYTSIRPESILVHSPLSPYERVDFAEGGVPHTTRASGGRPAEPRYQPQSQYPIYGRFGSQPPLAQSGPAYTHAPPDLRQQQQYPPLSSGIYEPHQPQKERGGYGVGSLDAVQESFSQLSFASPPARGQSFNASPPPAPHDRFASAPRASSPAPTQDPRTRGGYDEPLDRFATGAMRWAGPWNGARDVQA